MTKFGNPDEWDPQGDMRFRNSNAKNGRIDESYRWDNGEVIYQYDDDFRKLWYLCL